MHDVVGLVAFIGAVVSGAVGIGTLWHWGQRRSAIMAGVITLAMFFLGMVYFL